MRGSTSRAPRRGYALRLRFEVELAGPCVRCLEEARLPAGDRRRGRWTSPAPPTRSCAAPTWWRARLDVGRWANDALVLALPVAAALPPGLRRPLPGLRRVAQRRRPRGPQARHRRRPPDGEAARDQVRLRPAASRAARGGAPPQNGARIRRRPRVGLAATCRLMAVPKKRQSQHPSRQAPRPPQGGEAAPERVPALPQPAAAASGLPDLRHLRRPRGDPVRGARGPLGGGTRGSEE